MVNVYKHAAHGADLLASIKTRGLLSCRRFGAVESLLKATRRWRLGVTGTFREKRCACICCDLHQKHQEISSARTACNSMMWAKSPSRADARRGPTKRRAL